MSLTDPHDDRLPAPRSPAPRLSPGAAHGISTGLGWFSIGLGLAQVLAPGRVARPLGLQGHERLVQVCGLREIVCGIGVLTTRGADRAPWMAARVMGDILDIAAVSAGTASGPAEGRAAGGSALAGLAGIAALDAACAQALATERSPRGDQRRATGGPTADDPEVEQVILIERPTAEIADLVRRPETLAAVAGFHADVRVAGDRTEWSVPKARGLVRPWTMRLDRDDDQAVRWISEDGGLISSIAFHLLETDRGTALRLHVRFDPPGGMLGRAAVSLLGPTTPKAFVMKTLHFLKSLALTGEVPTTEGQPAARGDER